MHFTESRGYYVYGSWHDNTSLAYAAYDRGENKMNPYIMQNSLAFSAITQKISFIPISGNILVLNFFLCTKFSSTFFLYFVHRVMQCCACLYDVMTQQHTRQRMYVKHLIGFK